MLVMRIFYFLRLANDNIFTFLFNIINFWNRRRCEVSTNSNNSATTQGKFWPSSRTWNTTTYGFICFGSFENLNVRFQQSNTSYMLALISFVWVPSIVILIPTWTFIRHTLGWLNQRVRQTSGWACDQFCTRGCSYGGCICTHSIMPISLSKLSRFFLIQFMLIIP